MTIDIEAFEPVYQDWLSHRETCPNRNGVCSCSFPFRCRTCGATVPALGEDLPQYKDFGNGQCQACFFDPGYRDSQVTSETRALAEDTFGRIESNNEAVDRFYRTHARR